MAYENAGKGAAMKQGGYGATAQQSPYTNFNDKVEYVKAGHGGDSYQPTAAPQEQQPDYSSTAALPSPSPPPVFREEPIAPPKEQHPDYFSTAAPPSPSPPPVSHEEPTGGLKEKIKEKLAPCLGGGGGHSPPAHKEATSPPKKGVLEKVKDKISPHSS